MNGGAVFGGMDAGGHEQVIYCHNPDIGLRAIVAIHDTTLGPALGGLRMWPYDDEGAALTDVLRLSRGMTYKNALAGLEHGGGKAVIIGDPAVDRTEARMRCFGRFLDTLGGRYITAEDVGMTAADMEYILQETPWVTGTHEYRGGSGDPSPFTAQGAVAGIRACLRERFGHDRIGDAGYAVQGAGHVGTELIKRLRDHDARVFVCDVDPARVQHAVDEYGCVPVDSDGLFDTGAEVFVPCALGGVINPTTLPRLRCDIVAGAANNQLSTTDEGDELDRLGIVYAPDYAINAGGVMNVSLEMQGYSAERAHAMAERIEDTMTAIFARARRDGIPTWLAADRLAEARIAERATLRSTAPGTPAGAMQVPSGRH